MRADGDRAAPRAPSARQAFVECFALGGVAVAQPLLDLLERNAALFVLWRTEVLELLALVTLVLVVPAGVTWALARLGARLWSARPLAGHAAALALPGALVGLQAANGATQWGAAPVLAVAVAAGLAVAVVRTSVALTRSFLTYLAVAPLVFATLFVAGSPVTDVVFGASPAIAEIEVGRPARVVFLVLDELPTGSLLDGNGAVDADLYPNFARLAGDATWYRNHTTVSPFTETAVPAILTGRLPPAEGALPDVSRYPRNLFTLLGGAYDVRAQESVTRLCPRSICRGALRQVAVRPGFGGMVADVADVWRDSLAPGRDAPVTLAGLGGADKHALETGTAFVGRLREAARPRVDFLHVLLPHFPWHYLADGRDYNALPVHGNGLVGQDWASNTLAASARVRHLQQLQATDALLGAVTDRLHELDVYDDALIVVTADHGVAFEGGRPIRGVSPTTWPEIMWTPLFVKLPGQHEGVVDDRTARSIDVVPTIADALGIDIPWEVDGISLLGDAHADDSRPLLAWERNAMAPQPGARFLYFDGVEGFTDVLRQRGAPPGGDPALRTFRAEPWGGLVGEPLADHLGPPAATRATIAGDLRYKLVKLDTATAAWADISGTYAGPGGVPLAVAVNGVIAGVFDTFGAPDASVSEWWGLMPPQLFVPGTNDLTVARVEGPPDDPVLRPLTVDR
jgi:hypothetical protein